MEETFSEKRLDAIEATCQRHIYLRAHYPNLVPDDLCNFYFSCLYFGQQALRTLPKRESAPVLERLNNTIGNTPSELTSSAPES